MTIGKSGYGPGHEARGELTLSDDQPQKKCYYLQRNSCEEDLKFISSFLFEFDCYTSLHHPAIMQILGYTLPILDEKCCGIFFPDTSNKNLECLLHGLRSGNELSPTNQSIIIFGIAAEMANVHQNNIFHRTLNPSNIVIDDNFHPKVSDFLDSITLVEGVDQLEFDTEIGMPAYMAPEVVNREMKLTNKTDVYAFSSILYSILTKRVPYTETKMSVVQLISKKTLKGILPEVKEGEIPPILSDLMNRCWNFTPSVRPSFIQIVKEFMDHRNEYFNHPDIDRDIFNSYNNEVAKDLIFQ